MDLGDPISYLVLRDGTPVVTAAGRDVGTVEHVLADDASDVFDGIVIDTGEGHRFADAPQVQAIHERGVVLGVEPEELPEPAENPATMGASPEDTVPDDLGDKLRRAWNYLSGRY